MYSDALVGTFPQYFTFRGLTSAGMLRSAGRSHPVQSSPVFSELQCFKLQYGTVMFSRNVCKQLLTYAACNIPEQRRRQLCCGGSLKSYTKLCGTSVAYCHGGNQETENKFRLSSVLCSKWQPLPLALLCPFLLPIQTVIIQLFKRRITEPFFSTY